MWRSAKFGVHFSSRPCYRLVVILSITPAVYECFISNFRLLLKTNSDRPSHTREPIYKSALLLHGVISIEHLNEHLKIRTYLHPNSNVQFEQIYNKFWTKKKQNWLMYKLQFQIICVLNIIKLTKISLKLFNCKVHWNDLLHCGML